VELRAYQIPKVPGSPEHDICRDPGYFFSINVWHVRGLDSLSKLHAEFPALSINATLERSLAPTAAEWRADINFAANFTAVRKSDGSGELYFLSPVVGSIYSLRTTSSPPLLAGGDEKDCVNRTTCFASMSAALPGGGSNQHTNYANFRIFSETLLAGILEPQYELAIMNFRESKRGTLIGMTRFRDVLDDMPILGYGKSSLRHDRLYSFHNTLAGHSMNYISRGSCVLQDHLFRCGGPSCILACRLSLVYALFCTIHSHLRIACAAQLHETGTSMWTYPTRTQVLWLRAETTAGLRPRRRHRNHREEIPKLRVRDWWRRLFALHGLGNPIGVLGAVDAGGGPCGPKHGLRGPWRSSEVVPARRITVWDHGWANTVRSRHV
jgi:hypothetical protein